MDILRNLNDYTAAEPCFSCSKLTLDNSFKHGDCIEKSCIHKKEYDESSFKLNSKKEIAIIVDNLLNSMENTLEMIADLDDCKPVYDGINVWRNHVLEIESLLKNI